MTCAPMSKYQRFRYPLVRAKIGASEKAWVVPGSRISRVGAPGVGFTTLTTVTAASSVARRSVESAVLRARTPE